MTSSEVHEFGPYQTDNGYISEEMIYVVWPCVEKTCFWWFKTLKIEDNCILYIYIYILYTYTEEKQYCNRPQCMGTSKPW